MNLSTGQSLHTEGSVSDYFLIEGHLLSTRSADCYKAVDRSRNQPVMLWMLRHPLALESSAVVRFLGRMKQIAELSPAVCEMNAFGVDSAGSAFAVFPALDGHSVAAGNVEPAEAERRFVAAVKCIDQLHRAGVACGDLCAASFWITRDGDLRFIGIMGSFDSEAASTAMLPPAETIPYFAPEQRSGGAVQCATDVFALGVLGYYLFAKRFPFGEGQQALVGAPDPAKLTPLQALLPNVPPWADELFSKCLLASVDLRLQEAGDILKVITESRQRLLNQSSTPVTMRRSSASAAKDGLLVKERPAQPPPEVEGEIAQKVSSRIARPLILSLLFTVVAFSVYLTYRESKKTEITEREANLLNAHVAALGNDDLKRAVKEISRADSQAGSTIPSGELEKIINSDDPLAHEILIKTAKDASSVEARQVAEKAIVERARRLNLLRSAEQVKQWLRGVRQGALPPAYEPILKSLDTTLPIEARRSALRQAYASEPQIVLRLAAALAIDTGNFEEYQPALAQLVGDDLKLEQAQKYSAIALILIDPQLAMVFGEDVIQRREQMPDQDIIAVLKALAERNDINIRAVASLAVQRNILPPIRAQFLQLIRDRSDLAPDVINSLLRAAAGALGVEDLAAFGRWYDLEAERVLLGILADVSDADILNEAFDILTARSLTVKPSARLVTWVRKYYWEKRGEFAKAVGVLGNLDKVQPAAVDQMFASLDKFVRDSDLVDLLLNSDNQYVVKGAIERYPQQLSGGALLGLLDNSDKGIRIEAIKALKDFNDIGGLKIIIDHYDKETDPEVRQVYKDTFWMIKERQ